MAGWEAPVISIVYQTKHDWGWWWGRQSHARMCLLTIRVIIWGRGTTLGAYWGLRRQCETGKGDGVLGCFNSLVGGFAGRGLKWGREGGSVGRCGWLGERGWGTTTIPSDF